MFFILFFPQKVQIVFPLDEIGYSLFWRLPGFILILLLLKKPLLLKPKRDFAVLACTLPALCIAGFLVSLSAGLSGIFPPQEVPPPEGIPGWTAVILFSLTIGCLEEAYFRVYLPLRILELNQDRRTAYLASALVFALCHAYAGPWSFANALLAAAVLSLAYIKSASFPGIALAHGLYNIFVFLAAALK